MSFSLFWVTDYIQNEMSQEDAFNLKYLASNERVEHIIKRLIIMVIQVTF